MSKSLSVAACLFAIVALAGSCKTGFDESNNRIFKGSIYFSKDSLPVAFTTFELSQMTHPTYNTKDRKSDTFITDAQGGFRIIFNAEQSLEEVVLAYPSRGRTIATVRIDSLREIDFGKVYLK